MMKQETTMRRDEPEMVLVGRAYNGRGRLVEGGFVVFAGSTVAGMTPSFLDTIYFKTRQRLEDEGVISGGQFVRDYVFGNAAQAGCVIASAAIAATKKWHTEPDEDGDCETFEERHPELHRVRRSWKKAARPKMYTGEAEEVEVLGYTKSVIDGRKYINEWRGWMPVHKGDVYGGVVA